MGKGGRGTGGEGMGRGGWMGGCTVEVAPLAAPSALESFCPMGMVFGWFVE